MTLDDLIPPHVTATVRDAGLHKIAGAMLGVPELTIKEAVFSIGARAFMRRKEARAIVDGIAAYATLTNEKIAENPALMALLRRAAVPAAVGAGIGMAPHFMSNDPYEQQKSALPGGALGGLLGGLTGIASGVHGLPPDVSQAVAQALR
jgi:hypothetical protein